MNSNDQLELEGSCLAGCTGSISYKFSLFMFVSGTWIHFTNSSYYFTWGSLNSDLTIIQNLFNENSSQIIWKIQLNVDVVYLSQSYTGSTSMQIYVNYPPSPGLCNINPTNGTTSTFFQLSCNGWTDGLGTVAYFSFYSMVYYFNLKNIS